MRDVHAENISRLIASSDGIQSSFAVFFLCLYYPCGHFVQFSFNMGQTALNARSPPAVAIPVSCYRIRKGGKMEESGYCLAFGSPFFKKSCFVFLFLRVVDWIDGSIYMDGWMDGWMSGLPFGVRSVSLFIGGGKTFVWCVSNGRTNCDR